MTYAEADTRFGAMIWDRAEGTDEELASLCDLMAAYELHAGPVSQRVLARLRGHADAEVA